jgi:hypothetical protein
MVMALKTPFLGLTLTSVSEESKLTKAYWNMASAHVRLAYHFLSYLENGEKHSNNSHRQQVA